MTFKGIQTKHLDRMIWVLLGTALAVCGYLEHLTAYKAGVMRHLFYRKIEHLSDFYSPGMELLHISFAALILIHALILASRKKSSVLHAGSLLIVPALFLTALCSQHLHALYTYTYILYSLEIGMIALAASSVLKLRRA